jgi:hypothetical protein
MAERLTDKIVKALPAPTSGNKLYYDVEVKGFEAPPKWWTPLLSSRWSRKVSNGPGTASIHG